MKDKVIMAQNLLKDYKGKDYTFGINCLEAVSGYVSEFGKSTLLIISQRNWAESIREKVKDIFRKNNIRIIEEVDTSSPNTPLEDVVELSKIIVDKKPHSITCVGGGSAIDCAKVANILATFSPKENDPEPFFGLNRVSYLARKLNKKLYPLIAVQVASGSGSHLSKNANVTYTKISQKKLISDEIIVPDRAVFDYSTTVTMSFDLTLDGAMDGLSHSLEIYLGARGDNFELIEKVCLTSISMIVDTLELLINDLKNIQYREIMGLATDLGGYALMLGGTSGAHLNSFSLVDILTHGRACAILNPYYTVFFSTAVREKLKKLALIYGDYIGKDISNLEKFSSRELGELAAKAMINLSKKVGFPVSLNEAEGFSDAHIEKMISAAKNPQLEMKLKNMPVPLNISLVDEYIRPVLEAAKTGNFSLVKNMQ